MYLCIEKKKLAKHTRLENVFFYVKIPTQSKSAESPLIWDSHYPENLTFSELKKI